MDAVWNVDLLCPVPSGPVENQYDLMLLAGTHLLGKLRQNGIEVVGVDLVMKPPVVLARLGMDEG